MRDQTWGRKDVSSPPIVRKTKKHSQGGGLSRSTMPVAYKPPHKKSWGEKRHNEDETSSDSQKKRRGVLVGATESARGKEKIHRDLKGKPRDRGGGDEKTNQGLENRFRPRTLCILGGERLDTNSSKPAARARIHSSWEGGGAQKRKGSPPIRQDSKRVGRGREASRPLRDIIGNKRRVGSLRFTTKRARRQGCYSSQEQKATGGPHNDDFRVNI